MFESGYSVTVSSEPAAEPITTAEAKTQLRLSVTDDDTYIDTLIVTARRQVEKYLARALVTQTRVLRLDRFPLSNVIELPYAPIQSVSSVTYVDQNGTTQTWSSDEYRVDIYSSPGRITPEFDYVWPVAREVTHAVTVTYVCGYGGASDLPADIKHALKLQVTRLYENRGEYPIEDNKAATGILSFYRVHSF